MTTRPPVTRATAIAMRDLSACQTVADVCPFFPRLGYPVADATPPVEEYDRPGALRDGMAAPI